MDRAESMRSVGVLLVFLLLFFTSCSVGIRRNDLIGIYRLETKNGKATLRLLPDGRLEQTVEPIQGATRSVTGTWEWDQKSGDVDLKGAILIDASHIGLRADSIKISAGRSLGGILELECDVDLECAYRKQ